MRALIIFCGTILAWTLALPACPLQAADPPQEIQAGLQDRQKVSLTIYNQGTGFVRDLRSVKLAQGLNRLAFVDIASHIEPPSARLQGKGLAVWEQNYDFDLLTPHSLLKKHLGRKVGLARTHPTTGEDKIEEGVLLSLADKQAVFRIGQRIETVGPLSPYRFVFSDVPPNLRERPTLSMLVEAAQAGPHQVELTYMSGGLDWSMDYVGVLDRANQKMELKGWITLSNQSGTSFQKASLQLMAGDVHRAPQPVAQARYKRAAPAPMAETRRESLFEYHLYSVGRPVDIADRQTKQIEMLRAQAIPVRKEYVLDSAFSRIYLRPGQLEQKLKTRVKLWFKNQKPALGLPLPAGVVRLHQPDSQGVLQFIGEDKIDHTPEGREVGLLLGNAFDVTATRKMTDFKKIFGKEVEAAFTLVIHNAKDEPVKVSVIERIPGSCSVVTESIQHSENTGRVLTWEVEVPAKGATTLDYRVRVKQG